MYLELLEDQAAKEGLTNGIRGKKMDLDEYEKVRRLLGRSLARLALGPDLTQGLSLAMLVVVGRGAANHTSEPSI